MYARRVGLGVSLLSSTTLLSRRGGGFSPASLFAAGEQGAWYDPSDLTTLFQDSAGATPVTAAGQSVGLMLDKSRGLVLGPELGDGTINNVSNWVLFGSNTIAQDGDGVAITFVNNAAGAYQFFRETTGLNTNLTVGKWYRVTGQAKVNSGSANVAVVTASTWTSAAITSTSFVDFTIYFLCDNATTNYIAASNLSTGEVITIRALSVKELAGNHATQATAAQRPTYGIVPAGGRRNLLLQSGLTGATSGTPGTAPTGWPLLVSGGTTAVISGGGSLGGDAIRLSAVANRHLYNQAALPMAASSIYTFSVQCDVHTSLSILSFATLSGSLPVGTTLEYLIDGVVVPSGTALPLGPCEVAVRATTPATAGVATLRLGIGTAGAVTGDVTFWDPQFELGSTRTDYQRVGTAFDVTEAGVASRSYLSFDGTDDRLLSAVNINPGAVDKAQVFVGARSLRTTAGTEYIGDAGSLVFASNGWWRLTRGSGGLSSANFESRGTTTASAGAPTVGATPWTAVLTGLGDISAPSVILRSNGVQIGSSTATQGTGNYTTLPHAIGSATNGANPYNGQIFGLIVRFGTNLSTATVTQTETWLANRAAPTVVIP